MWPFSKKNISIIDLASAIWGDGMSSNLTPETALKVVDIYSCVRVLSSTFSALPLSLHFTDTRRGKALAHPYQQLVHRKPNSWMTPSDLKRLILVHLLLRGNFYAHKTIVGGIVRELNPIHPDKVTVEQKEDLSLIYKVNMKSGTVLEFPAEAILHIRGLSTNGFLGENVVSVLADCFGYAKDAALFNLRTLRNGAKPSGLLVFPDALKDEQYKIEVDRITKAASGEKIGSTLILDRGVDFKKVSLTATDLMLLDGMKLTRSQICGALGVPPHMIGDLDRATFSNIENQGLSYYVNAVMPLCATIEDALNAAILNSDEDKTYCFKFNPNAILRGDIKSRMEAYQLGIINGIYCPDEVRELEDMAPRADGLGGDYFYPANLIPAGKEKEGSKTETEREDDAEKKT